MMAQNKKLQAFCRYLQVPVKNFKFRGEEIIMKKRVVGILLCAAMTAAMVAGCGSTKEPEASTNVTTGNSSSDETQETENENTENTSENDANTEESTGGTLIMGTNAEFPPYEYWEGQEIVGIDAEMAKAVAEKLGMELKIEDMAFNSLITALSSGKVDFVAAGMTVDEDREAFVNFTDSYATGIQVIIVPEESDIADKAGLANKKIGVQEGTTGDIYVSDEVEGADVQRFNKGMEAIQALSQGKIDAVVIDNEPAKVFVTEVEGLKILEEEFVTEDYAIAIAKENTELLDQVNTALQELKADGTLQEIVDKYITAE